MAKNKSQTKREATQSEPSNGASESRKVRATPVGYAKRSTEVKGFWIEGETPVHFVPKLARAVDNSIDARKCSVLVIGESMGDNELQTSDGEVFTDKKGDLIGVWYKPGMLPLKDLANVPVYMYRIGERDTGKPNPMKLYDVLSPKTGEELLITGDFRVRSLRQELPFRNVATNNPPPSSEDTPESYGDEQEA